MLRQLDVGWAVFRLRGVHTDADAKGIGREDGRGHRDDRRSAGNAYKPAPRGSRRGPHAPSRVPAGALAGR